jgi:hypothetical protein
MGPCYEPEVVVDYAKGGRLRRLAILCGIGIVAAGRIDCLHPCAGGIVVQRILGSGFLHE